MDAIRQTMLAFIQAVQAYAGPATIKPQFFIRTHKYPEIGIVAGVPDSCSANTGPGYGQVSNADAVALLASSAQAVTAAASAGPLFVLAVKNHVGELLAADGRLTPVQVADGWNRVDQPAIQKVMATLPAAAAAYADLQRRVAGLLFAGIISAILAFLESPAGKALLKALAEAIIALLLGL